ncbi:BspA family leucine-rich repeat surface protein [Marivirga lumbricoides]
MKYSLYNAGVFLLILTMSISLKGQNYPPVLDKNTLKGAKGITFPNIDLVGSNNSFGNDVKFIGDINNDDLEDIAISSDYAVIDGNDFTGRVYIVFGTEEEFEDNFDLNSLDGDNGFVVEGVAEDERRGGANAGVGDINGDGIDDVIIGSDQLAKDMIVLYGRNSFPSLIKSSEIDGSNGFRIKFYGSNSVAGLGDVNGDGINDFIIGTPHWSGSSRIIFGRSDNFPAEIDEAYLDGIKGFSTSEFPASRASYTVGGAGDINNDGNNDILIGSWNAYSGGSDDKKISYALFGKSDSFDPLINITEVDGSDGFLIDNRDNGFISYVGSLGDINGDGIDDCFSENNVIFGSENPFPAALMRADFDEETGFLVKDFVNSMAPAGDLNFDGIDDFVIVGSDFISIVYGASDGFPVEFDREEIDGSNGFLIDDLSGTGRGIDGGKDFNGDGKADFIFPDRNYNDRNVYLVFGGDHFAIPLHDDYPKVEDVTTEGFSLNVKAKEKGKIHFAVFESSTNYSVDYETINLGSDAVLHGEFPLNAANTEFTKLIEGLKSSTEYDIHLYFEDEADNTGEIYSIEDIKTSFDLETAFVTTWDTEEEGYTNDDQIQLIAFGGPYDIHWEKLDDPSVNGIVEDAAGTNIITFPVAGRYKVYLPNSITHFLFNSYNTDAEKLLTVEQWGDAEWQSMEDMFNGCTNLTIPANDVPDLSNVTDMNHMFYQASSFNTDIGDWDVSNVTNFNSLFSFASSFNQDLNDWQVSNVTSMRAAFYGASSFNSNISDWDVSNVTIMNEMFRHASNFNQDISEWDVSKNTTMYFMFSEATNFNQDIGAWEVSKVENMYSTFKDSPAFDQNLGNWDISKVENIGLFLNGSGLSLCNYSATLEGWSELNLQDGLVFHGGNSRFTPEAEEFRQTIIDDFDWIIYDYGKETNAVTISVGQEVSCPGASDAVLEGGSSIPNVDFKWYNEEDELIGEDAILENLQEGIYRLRVEVSADCFFTKEITLSDGEDDESPEITCPENQSLTIGSNLPNYTSLATVSDNCDANVAVSQSPSIGTEFTEETIITLTAEDAQGNIESCTFTVEVSIDNEAPEIDCPTDQSLSCVITEIPDYTDLVSVSDNMDPEPVISQTPASGSPFTDGMTITMTAKDGAGNTNTCTFTVIREEDTKAPSITCPAEQSLVPGESLPDYTNSTVTDDCDNAPVITQSPVAGTVFTTDMIVTLTATDASGNTQTCTFEVTNNPDIEAPEISCLPDQQVDCAVTEVPDFLGEITVSDNRDENPVLSQTPEAGTEFTGETTITISVTDASGNSSECSFLLKTSGGEAPDFACLPDQELTAAENCEVVVPDFTELIAAESDCAEISMITQSPEAGTVILENTVAAVTVEDNNGQLSTCKFNLKVPASLFPEVDAGADARISIGESHQLDAFASQEGTYSWSPDVGLSNSDIPNPVASPEKSTTYTVTFTDTSGCVTEDDITIEVERIVIPKGFSPDYDGINDTWVIAGIENYPNNEVIVHNRWGNIIFSIKSYNNTSRSFSGLANRNIKMGAGELPEGTYYYYIQLDPEEEPIKGFIVLKK